MWLNSDFALRHPALHFIIHGYLIMSPQTETAPATGAPTSENLAQRDVLPSGEVPTSASWPRRFAAYLLQTLPTFVLLVALGGLAWWGHHSGWALPKFSQVTGNAAAVPDDWCEEHGVPESMCVECNPEDYPPRTLHGWCKVHGIHECPLHHPDVVELKEPAQIEQRDLDRAERALMLKPRAENNFACNNPGRRIQFATKEAATKAGVDVEPVLRSPIVESIGATGEIRYDETRIARLAAKSGGSVWRVEKQVGDPVQKGDLLALIDAADVGRAKAELQQALADWQFSTATVKRLEPLADSGGVARTRILDAEISVRTAWIRVRKAHQTLVNLGLPLPLEDVQRFSEQQLASSLQFLGLPRDVSKELNSATTTSNLLPVIASQSGIIVARDVVAGEVIDTQKTLFTVTDTQQMWLLLNIPLEEAGFVTTGQTVEFLADGDMELVTGAINWKSTTSDQKTRTVSVRATLQNSDGRLLNETFGRGNVILRSEPDAIVIPNEALQWDGSCHVVFVRDKAWFRKESPKLFHTRSVRPGVKTDDHTEIIAGVLPGEVVATIGSDVLRAQLLKNNLGAG